MHLGQAAEAASKKYAEMELEVLRHVPNEETQTHKISKISITFSLPVVELAAVLETEKLAANVVQVTPDISSYGRWRWMGTEVSYLLIIAQVNA